MKTLKIRLKLNSEQELMLNTLSNEHRLLYNYLLGKVREEKIDFKELHLLSKEYRKSKSLTINAKSTQNTTIDLINNIKSYYALRKDKNNNANFPKKFKGYKYFSTFRYDFNNNMGGFKLFNNHIIIQSFLKINLPEYYDVNKVNDKTIKQIVFKKQEDRYYIMFIYSEKETNLNLNKDNFVSIDLGISNIVTVHSNKINNFQIKSYNFDKLEKKVENLQSKRDLKLKKNKKYKNQSLKYKKLNKRFKKEKTKLTNKRKDYQHKVSRKVIDTCIENDIGTLIVGDIQTKKLKNQKGEYKNKRLNKSTQNSGLLSRFKAFLEYKAKNENIDFNKIDESYTSKVNCLTGEIEFNSALHIREVNLTKDIKIDRDLNSAINIAKRFLQGKWLAQFLDVSLDKMYLKEHSSLRVAI